MRRLLSIALAAAIVLTALITNTPLAYASPAEDETGETSSVVSASDAAYFDRVAVIPLDVTIPEFYQQVINVAGMYIFSTPDGTIHKRIYGALDGIYGWYIPVGAENIVPADAQPIDPIDDIAMYNAAVQQYREENAASNYVGILPPESGTYQLDMLFGTPARELARYTIGGTIILCLLILLGFIIRVIRRSLRRRRSARY